MRQVTDAVVRARNEGKDAVAARIVWAVEIAGFRFRCLAEETVFVVQVKQGAWQEFVSGKDAIVLLHKLAMSNFVAKLMRERIEALRR